MVVLCFLIHLNKLAQNSKKNLKKLHPLAYQKLLSLLMCNASFQFCGNNCGISRAFYLITSWLSGKESSCQAWDTGLIPGWGRSPGEGNGSPLQYSLREKSMDKESGGLQSMSCKESHTTEPLSTAQEQKRTPNEEKILSSVNAAGKTWCLHAE